MTEPYVPQQAIQDSGIFRGWVISILDYAKRINKPTVDFTMPGGEKGKLENPYYVPLNDNPQLWSPMDLHTLAINPVGFAKFNMILNITRTATVPADSDLARQDPSLVQAAKNALEKIKPKGMSAAEFRSLVDQIDSATGPRRAKLAEQELSPVLIFRTSRKRSHLRLLKNRNRQLNLAIQNLCLRGRWCAKPIWRGRG